MKANRKAIEKATMKNAGAQAFYAVMEEMDLYLPISKFYSMVKEKTTLLLSVAGQVAYERGVGTLNDEQVKTFIKMSALEPELVSGFWASLPSVIQFQNESEEYEETGIRPEHKKLWYGETFRAFPQEKDAVTFLMSFMTDEEIDVISDAALEKNLKFQERKDKEKEQLQKISEVFKK